MESIAELRGYLTERGLVGEEETVSTVDTVSSHLTRMVLVDGAPQLVIKDTADPMGRVHRRLDREFALYHLVARGRLDLGDVVPRCRWLDPNRGRLVVDAVAGATPLTIAPGGDPAEAAEPALEAIERIQRAGASAFEAVADFPTERPWVLALFAERAWVPEAATAALTDPRIRADVAEVLARAGREWRPETLVHGDLRLANCLVVPNGALSDGALSDGALSDGALADGALVRVIDWETTALGDAGWDPASVLADIIILAGPETDLGSFDRLLATTAVRFDTPHLVALTAARLVQIAIELQGQDAGRETVDRVLTQAVAFGDRAPRRS